MKQLVNGRKQIARPLKTLATMVSGYLDAGDKSTKQSLESYCKAGELLMEAKSQIGGGKEWRDWLRDNFNRSFSQASRYMRLAEAVARGERYRNIEGKKKTTVRKRGIPEAIRRIMDGIDVDMDSITDKSLPDNAVLAVERVLMRSVIDAGYRVLAVKLHPDKGGSTEAMRRLNHVRDLLRNAVGGALLHE
jgi:hypothetical protein